MIGEITCPALWTEVTRYYGSSSIFDKQHDLPTSTLCRWGVVTLPEAASKPLFSLADWRCMKMSQAVSWVVASKTCRPPSAAEATTDLSIEFLTSVAPYSVISIITTIRRCLTEIQIRKGLLILFSLALSRSCVFVGWEWLGIDVRYSTCKQVNVKTHQVD